MSGPNSLSQNCLLLAGMGSSRTGLDLEDTSRTKFCGLGLGLGLGLDGVRPWLWLQDLAVRL